MNTFLNTSIKSLFNTTEPTLADAILLASACHKHQADKSGKPYILHPLRVLHKVMNVTDDVITHFLAIFHDLLEDCYDLITVDDLIDLNYPPVLINELLLITKYKDDDYLGTYIPRIGTSYRCTLVKKIDIEHNTKIQRMHNWDEFTVKDIKRLEKYHVAYQYLCKKFDNFEKNTVSGVVNTNSISRISFLSHTALQRYLYLYNANNYLKFLVISGVNADDIIIFKKYVENNNFIVDIKEIVKKENLTNHCVSVVNCDKYDDNLIMYLKNEMKNG